MITYFNSSMSQKLLSTNNYGTGERTLGALAPVGWRLQVSLGKRQLDWCVICCHDYTGALGGLRESGWRVRGPEIES